MGLILRDHSDQPGFKTDQLTILKQNSNKSKTKIPYDISVQGVYYVEFFINEKEKKDGTYIGG